MSLRQLMLAHWYNGDNGMAYVDLVSGASRPSCSMKENWQLSDVAQELCEDLELLDQLTMLQGDAFFDAARASPEAAGFVRAYDAFMAEWGSSRPRGS